MSNNGSSSVYCFISDDKIHCIPINLFNNFPGGILDQKENDSDTTLNKLKIRNKNLLYSLNNPSLSDLECDSQTSLNNTVEQEKLPTPEMNNDNISSIIHNYSTHAIYLPKLTINISDNLNNDFKDLKILFSKIFPDWSSTNKIVIKQLTGGITNMLLSCKYLETDEVRLMRVYGHGTNLIIDRHREFISHLILTSLNLAPPIYSRFKNGLIYGFFPGRSLEPEELCNENIYPLIAQQLGNWHKRLDCKLVEGGVERLRDFTVNLKKNDNKKGKMLKKKFISNIWELIEDWINIVPNIPDLTSSFNENLKIDVDQNNLRDIIRDEFAWLKETLINSNSPVVSSHCDLLSGNIIIPESYSLDKRLTKLPKLSENPIQFIDYEYMLPAPRAFDIANHLAEWQGFSCDRSAIPKPTIDNPILIRWVKGYLNNEDASPIEISQLINEINFFYGLPGFYWGIWAMIQSEISNINFDYANYGRLRLQEYWDWKAKYMLK